MTASSSSINLAGSAGIAGTWKFISYLRRDSQGNNVSVMGEHPEGYLIYTPEGRMMVIVVAENRKPPETDADRIALHKFMVAYSGRYTIDGEKVVHHVDVSWNQAWTGTALVRFFECKGDMLVITTAPTEYGPNEAEQISTLTLRRVKN